MALLSPGVEVSVIDQSQYLPAPTNSIPFVLVATAQDKANPNGIGVAAATTAANAGKVYEVTSQRDLTTLYGNPFFYNTADGTPIQGYELNEYGLLAAYSALAQTNRAYILRADIDLASLVGSSGRPTGNPDNNTYWLDTTTSTWGIYEWDATTETFSLQNPIVVTDSALLYLGYPLDSIGSIGDYAVVPLASTDNPTVGTNYQIFWKNSANAWVAVGTDDWLVEVPAVVGTVSNPSLTPAETFTLTYVNIVGSSSTTTITVPANPNNTVAKIALEINNLNWHGVQASVNSNGRLQINLLDDPNFDAYPSYIVLTEGTGTPLADMGILSAGSSTGTFYSPMMYWGTSAQQPLWQASQSEPRPSGSVWIKVGSAGNGYLPVMSVWDSTAAIWRAKNVTLSTSDEAVTALLDSTGGKNIPANTVYAQYYYDGGPAQIGYAPSPVYYFYRAATGATVVTGTETNPAFDSGPYYANIYVSIPGSASLDGPYQMTLADSSTATDFVTAFAAAGAPYTTASITTDGAIQLTHTQGGVIVIDDTVDSNFDATNVSNGLLTTAGFVVNDTDGVKNGPAVTATFAALTSTGGTGTGFSPIVTTRFGIFTVDLDSYTNAGNGYTVGDVITVAGTEFGGATPANDLVLDVLSVSISGAVTGIAVSGGAYAPAAYMKQLSNWYPLSYTANEGAPTQAPADMTNWFYAVTNQVDIMVNYNGAWYGYRMLGYDSNGFPSNAIANATDPNGPIVSASEPTQQSDGTALVYGDLWVNTTDLDNYPVISRWQNVDGVNKWVLIDNTDQVNSTGIKFADARWSSDQDTINPVNDPIPTIKSLLTSDNLDIDAPEATLSPSGMLLWNTRRSGYNVKQFRSNYFNNDRFPGATLPTITSTWVSASGLQFNGAPYMGRKAQRAMIVDAMRAAVDSNNPIRDEDNAFNLLACPNYPELSSNLVDLNAARGYTGFIVGDTPMRLPEQATAITAWATNAAGAPTTNDDGCATRNPYLGYFYPSGLATEPTNGNLVAVPPSHMMLRTFLRNDTVAYPWLAAAGTRRGIIENASALGYLDSATGEFKTSKTPIGIRDTLYQFEINPLVFFTGNGFLCYGNKTSFESVSALDRINVARLVAYIRRQLTLAARPFVFEPNDAITRQQIAGVIESLMIDLVAKRGIYDYLVVCDESNNTPARIDRNELWVDVAIEPVKAAEFIYIPVRILNTGELGGAV